MLTYIVLILVLFVIYFTKGMKKPPNFPPGPPWLPFMGNILEIKKLAKSLGGQHHAFQSLAKKYNSNIIGLKIGKEFVIVVHSYQIVREILIREEFEGRPDNFFLKLRCLGKINGITCTDGDVWNNQRNIVNRHLRNLGFGKKAMDEMVQDEVSEILQLLKTDGDNISINKLIAPAVLNVLWTLITAERIPRNNKKLNELIDLFDVRSKAFDMTGGTLSRYPWLRFILPEWSGYNLIQKINRSLRSIFLKTIREHQLKWEEGKNDDLIYRYISEMKTKNQENHFTEDQLVMICLDLFIAGAKTTSTTLDFIFLMMVTYPDIQKKVHEEIDRNLDLNNTVSYSDRQRVPFIEAVILETMRYRTIVPITGPRRVLRDTILDGYNIPKNTTVLINTYSVHYNPEYWKDPDFFIPERFLDETGRLNSSDKLIPFGLGRRRCLGEILAKSCVFVFFVEVMRKYTISLADDSEPLTGKCLCGMIMSPERYKAKFTKRI